MQPVLVIQSGQIDRKKALLTIIKERYYIASGNGEPSAPAEPQAGRANRARTAWLVLQDSQVCRAIQALPKLQWKVSYARPMGI